MNIYNKPLYYDIAFSFVDAKKQIKLFEKMIKKYGRAGNKTFLDIACGPSLQLLELAKQGKEAIGLDLSKPMLTYLEKKAKKEKLKIKTIRADMINFKLRKKVDFAFIMMGSISYIKSNKDFISHLNSVASSLKSGGLYVIENFRLEFPKKYDSEKWTMKRDGIKVKLKYSIKFKDYITQMQEETIKMNVNDNGIKKKFKMSGMTKYIFPQELKALVKLENHFEFIGFFERDALKKLEEPSGENFIILRKKGAK